MKHLFLKLSFIKSGLVGGRESNPDGAWSWRPFSLYRSAGQSPASPRFVQANPS